MGKPRKRRRKKYKLKKAVLLKIQRILVIILFVYTCKFVCNSIVTIYHINSWQRIPAIITCSWNDDWCFIPSKVYYVNYTIQGDTYGRVLLGDYRKCDTKNITVAISPDTKEPYYCGYDKIFESVLWVMLLWAILVYWINDTMLNKTNRQRK